MELRKGNAALKRQSDSFLPLFTASVILAAFVGDNPAVVFNIEAATREQGSAANVSEKNDGEATGPSARVVAWPFGAPEVFRKNIELQKLGSDKNVSAQL